RFVVGEEAYRQVVSSIIGNRLRHVVGDFQVVVSDKGKDNIRFVIDSTDAILVKNREAYILDISSKGVMIKAPSPAGWFYAVETIMQLLPPKLESNEHDYLGGEFLLPALSIKDFPRF